MLPVLSEQEQQVFSCKCKVKKPHFFRVRAFGMCQRNSQGCTDLDHEVRLPAQNAINEILREVHGGRPFRIEVRRIDTAINAPGAQMPPPTSSFRFTWQYRSCTAVAADCGKPLLMERIQNHVVLSDVRFQLLVREICQRVDSQTV